MQFFETDRSQYNNQRTGCNPLGWLFLLLSPPTQNITDVTFRPGPKIRLNEITNPDEIKSTKI